MGPTDEARIALESKLNAIITGITALIEQTYKIRDNVPIKNSEDFVFGMIYQQYYRAIVISNVKYMHMHPQATSDSNLSDWIDIGLDVFRNKSKEIKEIVEKKMEELGME